jgi:uncharacterized protein with ParB-like and HNH nuclease domain
MTGVQLDSDGHFDDYLADDDDLQIDEYDLTATPNDFNVLTIFNFIQSGAVKIPGFQRNYVWDIKRASKLVESLILGLPVPQLFLYEESRNKFLVIDGQQRLLSLYYFIKQRFPRTEKRAELRQVFNKEGLIPDELLHDDRYFTAFKLSLPEVLPNRPNKFKGLNYATLGDYKTQFELRPIRNVIVKQNAPKDDDSSVFEIFNRLNSGGINLRPQEVRISLYHSAFFDMLYRINAEKEWRRILRLAEPDLHVKDVEVLLRGFAMLVDGAVYAPSMTKFLNNFSKKCRSNNDDENKYYEQLFVSFLRASASLPDDIFVSKRTSRFNVALFEAVFSAALAQRVASHALATGSLNADQVKALDNDPEFQEASQRGTTQTANVKKRLARARALITGV